MARFTSFVVTGMAVCSFFTSHAVAKSGAKDEGLASEQIQKTPRYGANATEKEGWFESNECSGAYCIYSNRWIADGRGVVMITSEPNYEKAKNVFEHLKDKENAPSNDAPLYKVTEQDDNKLGYIANTTIRRGIKLGGWSPVFLVHKGFFDIDSPEDVSNMLEDAVDYLPEETKKLFLEQNGGAGKDRTIKEIVLSQPFELDLGPHETVQRDDPHMHHFNFPEAWGFKHECRPNTAFHIDYTLSLRTTAARKVQPGEQLSIHIINPMLDQANRNKRMKLIHKKECKCTYCTNNVAESDERLRDISTLETDLIDPRVPGVTKAMVARYIELYKEEKLNTQLSHAYWQTALNYNYLGDSKMALKYGNLAVQASIVEYGAVDNNHVVEMRIMLADPEGHYSFKYREKAAGQPH